MENCKDLQKFFSNYLDDDLDEEIRNKIDLHLLECDDCCGELNKLKTAVEYLKECPKEKTPVESPAKIEQKIENNIPIDIFLKSLFKGLAIKAIAVVGLMFILMTIIFVYSPIRNILDIDKIKTEELENKTSDLQYHAYNFKNRKDSFGKRGMVTVDMLYENLEENAYLVNNANNLIQEDLNVESKVSKAIAIEKKSIPTLIIETVSIKQTLSLLERILDIVNIRIPKRVNGDYELVVLDEVREYYSFDISINKDKFVFLKQALDDKEISFSMDPDITKFRYLPFDLKITLSKIKSQ